VWIAAESESVVLDPSLHLDAEVVPLSVYGLQRRGLVPRGLKNTSQKHGAILDLTTGPLNQPCQLAIGDIAIGTSIVVEKLESLRQDVLPIARGSCCPHDGNEKGTRFLRVAPSLNEAGLKNTFGTRAS
jgi:hypothetical protein